MPSWGNLVAPQQFWLCTVSLGLSLGCQAALGHQSSPPVLCGSGQVLHIVLNQLDPF